MILNVRWKACVISLIQQVFERHSSVTECKQDQTGLGHSLPVGIFCLYPGLDLSHRFIYSQSWQNKLHSTFYNFFCFLWELQLAKRKKGRVSQQTSQEFWSATVECSSSNLVNLGIELTVSDFWIEGSTMGCLTGQVFGALLVVIFLSVIQIADGIACSAVVSPVPAGTTHSCQRQVELVS